MNNKLNTKQINFYYINSDFNVIVQKLCKKLVIEKKKTFIWLKDDREVNELDDFLWIKNKKEFLPHKQINEVLSDLDNLILSKYNEPKLNSFKEFDQLIVSPNVILKKFENFKKFFVFSKNILNKQILATLKERLNKKRFEVSFFYEYDELKWKLV